MLILMLMLIVINVNANTNANPIVPEGGREGGEGKGLLPGGRAWTSFL